ncbi:MAG: YifB family Mg chelatase-like AAA ATPase [Planctomycetes bacterium]|nr:YifB family Mg chelatase-like AAA ATPase [Planctomycetota bacterium]
MEHGGRPVVVGSGAVVGVDAVPVRIEATMQGEPGAARVLGSVDSVVREAYHRILSAFAADGLPSPRGSPLLNLAPADVPKRGSGFDLPIALALAGAGGVLPRQALRGVAALGEITLDGLLLPANGAVAIALAIRAEGARLLLAHPEDARRAAVVPGLRCVPVVRLADAVWTLASPRAEDRALPPTGLDELFDLEPAAGDIADLRGHDTPKTALLIAAAGGHDLLMVGPPGSGKSALLHRLPTILPAPSPTERLEVLRIHTAQRRTRPRVGPGGRPFRRPHHTSSAPGVLGGGSEVRPGEVTLAHRGVLFLDELPEFRRELLEGLRQPLEERSVTIGRAKSTVQMPADFQLVAAMNPCPCGYHGDLTRVCRCTTGVRRRYRARVSGPLLDRFDLRVEVPTLPPELLAGPPEERWRSAHLRELVAEARERQSHRNAGGAINGRLQGSALDTAVGDGEDVERELQRAMRAFGLSGRSRVRLLRVARTVADLAGRDRVRGDDVVQAARLRCELSD